jgi:hypothetical protein
VVPAAIGEQLPRPRESFGYSTVGQSIGGFDIHDGHRTVSANQQEVWNVRPRSPVTRPLDPERLRCDLDHTGIEISQKQPRQLQATFVRHQTLHRR